jgi:hypothetical protein
LFDDNANLEQVDLSVLIVELRLQRTFEAQDLLGSFQDGLIESLDNDLFLRSLWPRTDIDFKP